MSAGKDIDRAIKAKALLENPMFAEAFELTRQSILVQWERLPMKEREQAEDYRRCIQLLASVKGNLLAAINSGKRAEFVINEEKKSLLNRFKGIYR